MEIPKEKPALHIMKVKELHVIASRYEMPERYKERYKNDKGN